MRDCGLFDDERADAIQDEIEETVARAINEAEACEPDVESMFEHTYGDPTPRIVEQQEYLQELRERYDDKFVE